MGEDQQSQVLVTLRKKKLKNSRGKVKTSSNFSSAGSSLLQLRQISRKFKTVAAQLSLPVAAAVAAAAAAEQVALPSPEPVRAAERAGTLC